MLAPIIVFTYNRPQHTAETLRGLEDCDWADQSEVYIFSDYPKKEAHQSDVEATRQLIRSRSYRFAKTHIVERETNYGLVRNIIEGVSDIMARHGKAIIFEDDMLAHPSLLVYMNQALEKYQDREKVFAVGAYNFGPELMPIPPHYQEDFYFSYRPTSWGWASWHDRWTTVDWEVKDIDTFRRDAKQKKKFNISGDDMADMLIDTMDGELHSWYVRFAYAQFKQDKLAIAPVKSMIKNIGFDGSGVHCGVGDEYDVELDMQRMEINLPDEIYADPAMLKAVYHANRQSLKHKVKKRLARAGLVKW